MSTSIAIGSAKGGTGKTTVALNVAVALAEMNRTVLLVDTDSQGAIALALGRQDVEWPGLAELLLGQAQLDDVLVRTKLAQLSLLPRGRLDPVDVPAYDQALLESDTLRLAVSTVAQRFDYVLIDTPSGVGAGTRAALRVCDFALVPLQAEPLSLRSLGQILRVIDEVQRSENPGLRLLGIVPTMVELDTEASMQVMVEIWKGFGAVTDTHLPRATVFARASQLGLPLAFLGGAIPPEAKRFQQLAIELEDRISSLEPSRGGTHERPQRDIL